MITISLIGRLGANAERITRDDGSSFVKFSLATDDYDSKAKQKMTTWFNVTCDGSLVSRTFEYLTKGKMISLFGGESVGMYTNKDGKTFIERNVHANKIDFINIGNGSNSNQNTEVAGEVNTSNKPNNKAANMDCGMLTPPPAAVNMPNQITEPSPMTASDVNTSDDVEDDLPF